MTTDFKDDWNLTLTFSGKPFKASEMDETYARRASVKKIFAIDGLPEEFENDLISSSQVVDVPHTWRVKEVKSEDEVTAEILSEGKRVLHEDMKVRNATVFSYIGQKDDLSFVFLAAGAVRNKLTKDYKNNSYPVVSRAIVAPKFRGCGLGTLIVIHRMTCVLNGYYGVTPKAVHFGTESNKILHSVKKFEDQAKVRFVHIGDEQYETKDGVHSVHDYLCFLPWFQKKIVGACQNLIESGMPGEKLNNFIAAIQLFFSEGVQGISLQKVREEFFSLMPAVPPNKLSLLEDIREIFFVIEKIGAKDPV